jgi:hypothetical protein
MESPLTSTLFPDVPKSTKETFNPPSPGYGATSIQHPTLNIEGKRKI